MEAALTQAARHLLDRQLSQRALPTTARKLLVRRGFHGLSLEELARAAGATGRPSTTTSGPSWACSTRSSTPSRPGERFGGWRRPPSRPDLRQAVVRLVAASCGLWASDRALLRRLVGLAAVDPETASVAVGREQRREATWARLVQRLEAAEMLRPGVTRDQALRALMALTSFATYDALAGAPHGPVRP